MNPQTIYVLSSGFLSDMAHQAINNLSELDWPVSRSTLYRMAYQSISPSANKLVAFLDAYAATGLNPQRPELKDTWPLWDKVGEALTDYFASLQPHMGFNPTLVEIMERWVPVILAKPELQDAIIFPLHHIYPSYKTLHEMGAWDRSVSPYDLLQNCTPKLVTGFAKVLMAKYANRFKEDPGALNQLGRWRKVPSTTTLYTMKNQAIGKIGYQNTGANHVPGKELAKKAAAVAAMALGRSTNLHWEYDTMHTKAKRLTEELYQFGRYDIASLQQDFEARLRNGPFPCTVQATFTPALQKRYEDARKYRSTYSPAFGEVDEIMLNDLFCYSIASGITLKWTDTQLLAIALYFQVPLHCLLLWLLEATVIYRRSFATDATIMIVKQNICGSSDVSMAVYEHDFFGAYSAFTKTLSSSKASRYHDMKLVTDALLKVDHTKLEAGEAPLDELNAFYEMLIGAPNNYATNPLSDKEIKRIENRNDPEVARPSDLHNYDEDDDDEPAISLLDVLSEDDDDDEGFFIPPMPEGERFRMPTKPKEPDDE